MGAGEQEEGRERDLCLVSQHRVRQVSCTTTFLFPEVVYLEQRITNTLTYMPIFNWQGTIIHVIWTPGMDIYVIKESLAIGTLGT